MALQMAFRLAAKWCDCRIILCLFTFVAFTDHRPPFLGLHYLNLTLRYPPPYYALLRYGSVLLDQTSDDEEEEKEEEEKACSRGLED